MHTHCTFSAFSLFGVAPHWTRSSFPSRVHRPAAPSQRPALLSLCLHTHCTFSAFSLGMTLFSHSDAPIFATRAHHPVFCILSPCSTQPKPCSFGAGSAHAQLWQCVFPYAAVPTGRAHFNLHGLSVPQLSASALLTGCCVCTRTALSARFLYVAVPHWTRPFLNARAQCPATLSQRTAH